MTETQATSGVTGTSTAPAESDAPESGDAAAARVAVGRATVPADSPAPKYTRPAGMAPPPDSLEEATSRAAAGTPEQSERTAPVPVPGGPNGVGPMDGPPTRPMMPPATGRATATVGVPTASGVPVGTATAARTAVGGAKVSDAMRAARAAVSSAAGRGPRRARLFLKRIDPWSVMKFSFAVSFVMFFVAIVATTVLYLALDAMGVFDSLNRTLVDNLTANGGKASSFKITAFGVIGSAGVLGLINVVLFTALATLGAFIYNVCADLVGGIEVTLSEKE